MKKLEKMILRTYRGYKEDHLLLEKVAREMFKGNKSEAIREGIKLLSKQK